MAIKESDDALIGKVFASLSEMMVQIAKGPLEAVSQYRPGTELSAHTLGSLSGNMRQLSNKASLAASMASLLARIKGKAV
ncbi:MULTISPECIES: hypothetical protein [unclassified Neorhizobium]|uniref:hypothetical protein n=1 Tax=unclassified Neorhizobium TaxID=2629175 RepID=UPI001FF63EE6|nr:MULTISPECIES: hypothetical protein [unclassified Neorhizobium]MCJ9668986.1 hypothetical protein [Neorhizobium sp. SHOUNA12B]MCJ9744940.1 hypothetical protein [Neorhizobium sp. SHOUNA12A]